MQYTVQSGDTLGTIAKKLLGSSDKYLEILKANPQIANANLIHIGDVIEVPVSKSVVAVSKAISTSIPQPSLLDKLKGLSNNKPVMIGSAVLLAGLAYVIMNKFKKGIA